MNRASVKICAVCGNNKQNSRGIVQGSVEDVRSLKKNISKGIKAIMKKFPAKPGPLIPLPKEPIS
jgi:cell division ATPase FtsA